MAVSRVGSPVVGLLVTVLIFVPVALSGKAPGQGRKAACGIDNLGCAADSTPQSGLQSETLLVQMQGLGQRASASSVAGASASAGLAVAAHVQGFFSNLFNVGQAIKAGFDAVKESWLLFTEGEVLNGLSTLAHGLIDAVKLILPSNIAESAAFTKFQDGLSRVSEAFPGVKATVSAGVKAFKEEGDVLALLRSSLSVIQSFGPSAMHHLPEEVNIQVAKYLGALEDALEGFEQAMEVYTTGNATDAAQEVYMGLRTAVGELVPEELQSNENFTVIVNVLDATIADLSTLVLRVKQRLLQGSACWKVYTSRDKARPDICPSNHRFDGLHWCFAEGSSPPVQIKSRNGICLSSKRGLSTGFGQIGGYLKMSACDASSSQQQWSFDSDSGRIKSIRGRCLDSGAEGSNVRTVACRDDNPNQEWAFLESDGSIRTKGGLCLHASEYAKDGAKVQSMLCDAAAENQRWLMAAGPTSLLDATVARKADAKIVAATCDERTQFKEHVGPWCYKGCPAGTEAAGTRCRTKCTDAFPVGAPLMCATNYRTLALALQEMASKTSTMVLNSISTRSSLGLAGGLQHTIDALVEMGLGFTYPRCP